MRVVVLTVRRPVSRRQAALAGVLAVGAHVLALLGLAWPTPKLEPLADMDALPTMELSLVRIRPAAPAAAAPANRPRSRSRRLPTPAPAVAPRVLTGPSIEAPALAPPSDEGSIGDPRLSGALRGLIGCSSQAALHLTGDERAACDRRPAVARPAQVSRQFSAEALRAFTADKQESIFTRKPHNECLPHIGNTPGPDGSGAGNTTFGIACEWDFW